MRSCARVTRLAAALLFIAACGSSAPSASSCDAGCWQPTAADEAFATSFCGLVGTCCVGNPLQPDAGAGAYTTNCQEKVLRAGFSRDEALRSACLAELEQAAGSAACLPDYATLDSSCMRTFYEPSGPLAPGQRCTASADCKGRPGAVTI